MEVEGVLNQACLAISVLAVKRKTDRVHNGNTRKLVTKGKTVFSNQLEIAFHFLYTDVELS